MAAWAISKKFAFYVRLVADLEKPSVKSILLAISLAWAGASFAECLDGLIRETPDEQFTLAPQWATHTKTQLMWARCSLGTQWDAAEANCLPPPNAKLTYTWLEAIEAANQSRLGGFSDWRLPNKNELMSIADHACTGPAINERVFRTQATPLTGAPALRR